VKLSKFAFDHLVGTDAESTLFHRINANLQPAYQSWRLWSVRAWPRDSAIITENAAPGNLRCL